MEALRSMLTSSDPPDSSPPLAVLYSRCHAVHSQQDRLVASKDFELINAAVSLLARTEVAVESVGVFSSNEDNDDLATANIKYLLVPYYRGSLLSAAPVRTDGGNSASTSRLAAVSAALTALGTFLQRCEQYDMLGALGTSAMDAATSEAPLDPAAKRTFKVEKFKREKALNSALGALEGRRAAAAAQEREDEAGASGSAGSGITRGGQFAASASPASSSSPAAGATTSGSGTAGSGGSRGIGGGGGVGGAGGGGGMDEEDERQLWEWRVELGVLQALDLQTALKQEVELLQHAATRETAAASAGPGPSSSTAAGAGAGAAGRGGPGQGPPSEAERTELMERLRAICGDLDGGRREQTRQNVFKPGHILPTMTVEEAGEIEFREAQEREGRQRRQQEKEAARRAAMDSDEEDGEDKARQRALDDWGDSHPKGYGNSKLRPCG